jgi:hypothetical protein
MRLSERETKVLKVLVDHYNSEGNCLYFSTIARGSGLDKRKARIATRSLARKGCAQFVRGLFDDDGMVAGSGYCCTPLGKITFDNLEITHDK